MHNLDNVSVVIINIGIFHVVKEHSICPTYTLRSFDFQKLEHEVSRGEARTTESLQMDSGKFRCTCDSLILLLSGAGTKTSVSPGGT
jgi:hypothetical protein